MGIKLHLMPFSFGVKLIIGSEVGGGGSDERAAAFVRVLCARTIMATSNLANNVKKIYSLHCRDARNARPSTVFRRVKFSLLFFEK